MEKRSIISKNDTEDHTWDLHCRSDSCSGRVYLSIHTWQITIRWDGRFSIWGVDVSGLDAKQAEEKITAEFADRPVSFQENDQEVYSTTLKELGYSLNEEALLSKLTEIQKQREESRKLFPRKKI